MKEEKYEDFPSLSEETIKDLAKAYSLALKKRGYAIYKENISEQYPYSNQENSNFAYPYQNENNFQNNGTTSYEAQILLEILNETKNIKAILERNKRIRLS